MRLLLIFISIAGLIIGCASSSKNSDKIDSLEHLVAIEQPDDEPNEMAKVYIDSLKTIQHNNTRSLLIHGTFPDGCTKLRAVSHHLDGDSLSMDISAWRNPNMMCTQALTPFSYLYDGITEEELNSHKQIFINGTPFSLNYE
ncbi:hypothetical protein [Fodinibius sp. Rm-B-1B1-1]|uniref:hypothetical protein n=1 Tax=Fodinibius alkaliphilus TaxID=3140241 RepID=UPI00315B0F59